MLLRYTILSLLRDEEMHGYRIKSAFEERTGRTWPLNFGQIYAVLKELKRRNLIVGRLEPNGSHMGRWVYAATDRGRRSLATWLARRPQPPVPVRNEIFIRLLGAGSDEVEASLAQLERQEGVYRAYLDELKDRRSALRPVDPAMNQHGTLARLTVDAAVFQVEAHLRWLRHCGRELQRRPCEPGTEHAAGRTTGPPTRRRQRRTRDARAGALIAQSNGSK